MYDRFDRIAPGLPPKRISSSTSYSCSCADHGLGRLRTRTARAGLRVDRRAGGHLLDPERCRSSSLLAVHPANLDGQPGHGNAGRRRHDRRHGHRGSHSSRWELELNVLAFGLTLLAVENLLRTFVIGNLESQYPGSPDMVLVVGTGPIGAAIAEHLAGQSRRRKSSASWDFSGEPNTLPESHLPVFGEATALLSVLKQYPFAEVYVAGRITTKAAKCRRSFGSAKRWGCRLRCPSAPWTTSGHPVPAAGGRRLRALPDGALQADPACHSSDSSMSAPRPLRSSCWRRCSSR